MISKQKYVIGTMIYGAIGDYFGRFENGKRNGEGVFKDKKMEMYILFLGNMELNMVMENLFNDTKMKIAGNWENGKINHGKWIFPNGTYFESPFVNNYPQGEGVWHFINGNVREF